MSAVLNPTTESMSAMPSGAFVSTEAKVLRLPNAWIHPTRKAFFRIAAKNLLITPILPLACYYGLDATGVTTWVIHGSPVMSQILGEGFGHAGLCFSLHYVIKAVKATWSALTFNPTP